MTQLPDPFYPTLDEIIQSDAARVAAVRDGSCVRVSDQYLNVMHDQLAYAKQCAIQRGLGNTTIRAALSPAPDRNQWLRDIDLPAQETLSDRDRELSEGTLR